ncbi:MAG TPA: polyprenol monophosphomannose synthase [Ktedonobacterales bacterium]|nr:polyprenol monophosphomannose synthase [Ktedonobacterales bacterium]
MKSLIVIPTYNERENIVGLIEDILRVAPATDILIIDDNSPDGTGRIADDLHTQRPQVSVLHRAGKLGLGTAYIRGFEYAIEHGYDFVFEMDADYSHDPRYLPDFFAIANDADLVIGSRYVAGGGTPNWSALRKLISGGGNTFARAVLRIPVHDCTAGFRCYRTSALSTLDLEQIRAQGYAFQVEMAYIFWKRGYRIRETPIIFVDRRVGKSKMSRKIFVEGFVWVLRTRLLGDAVAKSALRVTAPRSQTAADAATESATSRPLP